MHGERIYSSFSGKDKPDGYSGRVLITVAIVSAAGLYCLCRAFYRPEPVEGPDAGWRLLSMVALAFVLGPLNAEVHGPRGRPARFSLAHSPLFASALTLGPATAALPAVFCGISRLLTSDHPRPLDKTLYDLLKPAAVSAASSAAYLAAGGSRTQPQSVESVGPVLAAAAVYAAVAAVLAGLVEVRTPSDRPPNVTAAPIPGWFACLAVGYALAALYSAAPAYVLLTAAGGIAVLRRVREGEADPERRRSAPSEPAGGTQTELPRPESDCEIVSFVDPATGLASRRYTDMFLAREISRAERMGHEVSVAVFDIDGSRLPDDGANQQDLELLLAEIGQKLRAGLRDYDVVGRYSAGRLILVLPESSADQTLEVVERLHASFGPLRIGRRPVSVSAGVAACPRDASSAEDLVNAAHRALNRGRFTRPGAVHRCEELEQAS